MVLSIGGEVEAGANSWKRVDSMGEDARGDRPRTLLSMKKLVVNSHTTRSDFWRELLPVPLDKMLEVIRHNAKRHNDRGVFDEEGLLAFFIQLDGTVFWKEVKRCKVVEDYYRGCGYIDQHNQHRQGSMKLKKLWVQGT